MGTDFDDVCYWLRTGCQRCFRFTQIAHTSADNAFCLTCFIAINVCYDRPVLGLTPALSIGLLLVARCPSGSTSNFLTKLGGGNAALSVTSTALISVIIVFSLRFVQLILSPMLGYAQVGTSFSFIAAVEDISSHTLSPVVVGMLFRVLFVNTARRIEPLAVKQSLL